jgi:hypothetical protein
MKLHRLFILSGLLLGTVPAVSYAGCSPACAEGVSCRITAQGPPTVYACDSAVRAIRRGPQAAVGGGQSLGGGSAVGPTARSGGPNSMNPRPPVAHKDTIEIQSVNSPRDAQSGKTPGK